MSDIDSRRRRLLTGALAGLGAEFVFEKISEFAVGYFVERDR